MFEVDNENSPVKVIGQILLILICFFIIGLCIVKIPAKTLRRSQETTQEVIQEATQENVTEKNILQ